ncbi:MAG: hypothetical protein J6R67_01625 [Treponema sp.]|nr:hypothetical protein [Treponema sp.]
MANYSEECIMKGDVVLVGKKTIKKTLFLITVLCLFLSLLGCDMWYKDWKGYMEHWTGTVKVENVQWTSHPESQRNTTGQITIPTNVTISTTVNISNPENYALNLLPGTSHIGGENEALKSVQVYGDAGNWVRPRTEIISSSNTGFELLIHPISSVSSELSRNLEHTDFTVRIIPCRSDSGATAANFHNIAFRYNTPPRTIREVVVVQDDSGAYRYDWLGAIPQMKAVDENTPLWEATAKTGNTEMDDYLFWAWPKNNTGKTDPDYIEKFQVQIDSGDYIDLALKACVVPGNPLLLGDDGNLYTIYRYKVGSGANLRVRAVDGEGVAGQALSSGVAPFLITINPTEGSVNGSQAETTIYKSGGTLITSLDLPNPIHSNDEYVLAGWATSPDGVAVSFPYTITEAVTFYALWQQKVEEVLPPSAGDSGTGSSGGSISADSPVIANPTDLFTVTKGIDSITFTVKDGYTNPHWYVNGIEQVSSGNVFNIIYRDKDEGVYNVMLLVDGTDGKPYSAQYQLEIAIPQQAADGSYEFSTAAHFQWLAEKVKSGGTIEVKLITDIVVPSGTLAPIHIPDGFVVHLDGQGHSITINEDYSDKVGDTSHYGVFAMCNYSTIENLVLKGSLKVNTTGAVGAVSGYMFASTLRNIMSEMTITNLNGNVMNTSHTGTGGLVGYFGGNGNGKDSVIENCAVYADVTTQGDGGGLVGMTWKGATPFTIKNSLYKGNVSAVSAGAVMGFNGNDNRRTSTLSDIFYYEKDSLPILGGTNGGGLNQTNVTAVTEDKFKEQATVDLVNGGQSPAKWILGDKYPVLKQ